MADDHWFDAMNKTLVQRASRRTMRRAASVAVSSLALGAAPFTEAAKNRKKKKDKKRKDKPKPSPTPSCSGGDCAREWESNQAEIDYCEFICRQCDGDDLRQFCIVAGNPGNSDKVAFCCAEGRECCGNQCCGDPRFPEIQCCDDQCVNTLTDENHCNGCGRTCVGPGLRCCDGDCVRPRFDENHCGGCNRPPCTGLGKRCCDGACLDTGFDNAHCGSCNPCAAGWECCHGRCVDSRLVGCCPDHPFPGTCPLTHRCCTGPSGAPGCCQA